MGHFEKFSQEENLQKDERILAYVEGSIQKTKREIPSKGILILTNFHLIFFRSGFTGKRLEKYPLREITATSYKGSVIFKSSITVNFQSHAFDFLGDKKKLEDFYKKLDNRDELIKASTTSSDAPPQQKSETPLTETSPLKAPETLSEKTEITPTEKSPLKSKTLWVVVGAILFFMVIAISNPDSNKASNQTEKEEVKDYSIYSATALTKCADFLGKEITSKVPKFSHRSSRVIYQKKDAYRYLVKGTFEIPGRSSKYIYYCDVLYNDSYKGEYARVNPANWTFNALEANEENKQSSPLKTSWEKDASSEEVVFKDGSFKAAFGKDDYSIDAVSACQTLAENEIAFGNQITSGAHLFKNELTNAGFAIFGMPFYDPQTYFRASPQKEKNRYIVEDTFVLQDKRTGEIVEGTSKYSFYCDITYSGKEEEKYSSYYWKVNSLTISEL